jgi:orotate phosphoribosyltransferase
MIDNMFELREVIVKELQLYSAIQLGKKKVFTLSSGLKSPVYIDIRSLLGSPWLMRSISHMIHDTLPLRYPSCVCPLDVDCSIAGGETAGIAFASSYAATIKRSVMYVRKRSKSYGAERIVEGGRVKGEEKQEVILFEECVTTGKSVVEFVGSLREAGYQCQHCLTILNYGFTSAEQKLAEIGVTLHAVFPSLSCLLGYVDEWDDDEEEAVADFIRENGGEYLYFGVRDKDVRRILREESYKDGERTHPPHAVMPKIISYLGHPMPPKFSHELHNRNNLFKKHKGPVEPFTSMRGKLATRLRPFAYLAGWDPAFCPRSFDELCAVFRNKGDHPVLEAFQKGEALYEFEHQGKDFPKLRERDFFHSEERTKEEYRKSCHMIRNVPSIEVCLYIFICWEACHSTFIYDIGSKEWDKWQEEYGDCKKLIECLTTAPELKFPH